MSGRTAVIAAVALAVLHCAWILLHFAPATMSPDANGYVVQARLIATEGRTAFAAASPTQFIGMHWLETEPGVFHSRYPAGLPMLFAAAWKLGGLRAALLVNPLLASATVLLVFFLARRFVGPGYALLAAVVVATVPVSNQHALDADAHIAAGFFLVSGVLALLQFAETRRVAAGLLAGVLLGAIPTIRYPEAIVGLAIAGWLLWQVRPVMQVWPAVAGAALPLGALLVHNAAAYGAFWRTGYALTHEQTGFGWSYFTAHALPYLQALGGQGLALCFAFGAAGLAALVADPVRRREGILFAGIVVPLVLLYMAYYFGGGGPGGATGNLRFLVPTFPFLAVAAVWWLARIDEKLGRPGRVAAVAVAVLQLTLAGVGSAQMLAQTRTGLTAAAAAHRLVAKEVPAGSVVVVDHALAESLDGDGRWKLVEENLVGSMGGRPGGPFGGMPGPGPGPGSGGPDGDRQPGADTNRPSPQQVGKNHAQQERYAGLRGEERRRKIWNDIVAWADGRPVYWLARSLDAVDAALPAEADYRSIGEVDAPMMIGPGGGSGPMPGGMGGLGRGGPLGGARGAGPVGMAPGGGARRGGPAISGPGGMGSGRGGMAAAGGKLRLVKLDLKKTSGVE
jgi:hypothetical protein